MRLWRASSPFERLFLAATLSGAAGLWLVWPPLTLLFVSASCYSLAILVDRRTVVVSRTRKRSAERAP